MENQLEAVNGFREPWYAPINPSAKPEVLEGRFWVYHTPKHFATVTMES